VPMPLTWKVAAEQVMMMMMMMKESERERAGESVLVAVAVAAAVAPSKDWNSHASLGAVVGPPMNHHTNSNYCQHESWRLFRWRSIWFLRQP
jgi:hypothetical protein